MSGRPAWVGKRRDETEPDIVKALEDVGAEVERLDRPCDLAVYFRSRIYLIECDGITSYRKRDPKQLALFLKWGIPIVRTPEAALLTIGAIA